MFAIQFVTTVFCKMKSQSSIHGFVFLLSLFWRQSVIGGRQDQIGHPDETQSLVSTSFDVNKLFWRSMSLWVLSVRRAFVEMSLVLEGRTSKRWHIIWFVFSLKLLYFHGPFQWLTLCFQWFYHDFTMAHNCSKLQIASLISFVCDERWGPNLFEVWHHCTEGTHCVKLSIFII